MKKNNSKFYKKIGKLDKKVVKELLNMILVFEDKTNNDFQRIEFTKDIYQYLENLFENQELKIQVSENKDKLVQKSFVSGINYVYPIHKDGEKCKSALNIALQCNKNDWIRWYSDELINSLSTTTLIKQNNKSTRNSSIDKNTIPNLVFLDELKVEQGDVYVLDVDTYHTWYSSGPKKRVIIQTKFQGFPNFTSISESLTKKSYKNLTKLYF